MENELEKFIRNNRHSFDRKMPDPAVLNRVLQQMQPKEEPRPRGILVPFRVMIWAAASVMLMAFGIVYLALKKSPDNTAVVSTKVTTRPQVKNTDDDSVKQTAPAEIAKTQPEARKSIDAVDEDLALRKQALMTKLKAQSQASTKEVVFAGLNDMDSPASRINAASATYKLKNTGNDIVNALIEALNTDPSANVRLAALDGLARFYQEAYVRKKLIASLKKQQDPVVQITMINLLIRMRESGILQELDNMVNDENTQKAVKDCAYSGILQLRSS